MYTFILSTILVTIISLCIFKNRFWENRYLVLLIIAGTALVSMITINYAVRGGLPQRTVVMVSKDLIPFHYEIPNDTTYVDTIVVPNLGELNNRPRNSNFIEIDSIKQIKSHIMLYEYESSLRVGWNADDKNRVNRNRINRLYFGVCNENPRYETRTLKYDARNNMWLVGFSLPEIATINVLYIPQHEYDVLSEEYKQEIPF